MVYHDFLVARDVLVGEQHYDCCQQHAWQEGNSAESGDCRMVDLTFIGNVVELVPSAEVQNEWYEAEAREHAYEKCADQQ